MSDGWHEVMCDDLEFQASKDKAEEKPKISPAMSTQWKKYPQDIPEPGEPIWWLPLVESSAVRFYYFEPQTCRSAFFWQPAFPPPALPDESESAFEEWWKGYKVPDSNPYSPMKTDAKNSWDAALAWHKNKTKE